MIFYGNIVRINQPRVDQLSTNSLHESILVESICHADHACMHACMHACIHARTHARMYVRTHAVTSCCIISSLLSFKGDTIRINQPKVGQSSLKNHLMSLFKSSLLVTRIHSHARVQTDIRTQYPRYIISFLRSKNQTFARGAKFIAILIMKRKILVDFYARSALFQSS